MEMVWIELIFAASRCDRYGRRPLSCDGRGVSLLTKRSPLAKVTIMSQEAYESSMVLYDN